MKFLPILSTLTSLVLGAVSAVAQGRTVMPPHPPFRPMPPIIWIDPSQGKLKPMEMQGFDADIRVRGHLATTTIEMTFYNPNERVLEGELVFPLGEGQTIAGYALEVNGKMRQAVVVEKQKGREVFEDVVRRGIDPGLAEITKGNVFRTRVYPLPPRGTKRVTVSFEQELIDDEKGFRYLLPMGLTEKVKRFHARAEVVKLENAPMPDSGNKTEVLTFEKWRDSFVAELTKDDYTPDKPLSFIVPKMPDRPQVFLVNDRLEPEKMYFNVHVEPEILPAEAQAKPQHIALFYDASGSAAKRDRKREDEFLKSWLKSLENVTVDLVAFRNDADLPVSFTIKNGDASALLKAIDDLPIDGGTSLGAVDIGSVKDADTVVLMSDGFSNFGPAEPKLIRAEGKSPRVFAVHAAQMVDASNLQRIARKCAGRVLDLIAMKDDAALAAMRGESFQFLGAKVLSGKATEIVPSLPEPVTRGFTLAGQCRDKCEIELSFGFGNTVSVTRRVTLNPDDALEPATGDAVRRAWAQRKIAELALDPKRNESAITALGKEHRVVTSGTSLIVLDRIEDYARHQIEPAEPELRDQYLSLLRTMPKDPRRKDEAAHLDDVARQWSEFKNWHAERHPWLESVLKPAAEREARLYETYAGASSGGKPKLSSQDAAEARELLEKARSLAESWNKEGRKSESRIVWEREATEVMLAVDALHQRRIEAFPESEVSRGENGRPSTPVDRLDAIAGRPAERSAARHAMPMSEPAAPAAPPPPVMSPTPSAQAAAAPGGAPTSPAKAAKDSLDQTPLTGTIKIKAWDPDTPYLKKLKNADDAYAAYLQRRKDYADSSAFFLDCADYFMEVKKDSRISLRVLSNLAEMELENAPLLRILAYRLEQLGKYDLAVPLFEEVLQMRGEEPQSRRDLALALSRMEQPDFTRAARLLWEVVKSTWDSRFPGIEIIALHELNDLLSRGGKEADFAEAGIEKRFIDAVPLDLRVVLTWDADNTDIDLWVTDPAGETCIYSHNTTQTGGRMSNDFTRGYGPEVFTIRRALPGTYTVRVNYYGNSQQKLAGATTVQVEFQTSFNRKGSKRESVTRRLQEKREVIEIGKFVFKPDLIAAE